MAKEGVKTIHLCPEFIPQVSAPQRLSIKRLLDIARENFLTLNAEDRKKKLTLESLASRMLTNQRIVISSKNTGKFYVELFRAMFGGEILRENKMPLFPDARRQISSDTDFFPDIVINGDIKPTYVEVKATSYSDGRPRFGYHQIANYCRALLENPGSEVLTGIFRYGRSKSSKLYVCANEDNHLCDNRCLVDKLSSLTRNLLIIPHNLLTFLLMLSRPEEMNQTSSNSSREFEIYKRILGRWITLFHQNIETPDEAIPKILENAKSKHISLGDFTIDDFYLRELTAKQFQSSDRYTIYCRSGMLSPSYRIKPFAITHYKTPYHIEWMKYFAGNLEKFLDGLWIKEIYDKKTEEIGERTARQEENLPLLKDLKTPNDGIPI